MKQPDIETQAESKIIKKQIFFGADAVETAQRVVPLARIQDNNAAFTEQIHSPHIGISKLKNRFSPSILVLILLLTISAIGGIGALFYNSPAETMSVAGATAETLFVQDIQAVTQTDSSEVIPVAETSPTPQKTIVSSQTRKNSRNQKTFRINKYMPVYIPVKIRRDEYNSDDDDDNDKDSRKERRRKNRRERKDND